MRDKLLLQHGGVVLKNTTKQGFQPIIDMLRSSGATLQVLSISSLHGIILQLIVREEHAEYDEVTNNRMPRPVTNYVLKITVLGPHQDMDLPPYHTTPRPADVDARRVWETDNTKASESNQTLFNEARMQQMIWERSIVGGRGIICPPIANLAILNQRSSFSFAEFIRDGPITNPRLQEFSDFLIRCLNINPLFELGIILMPMVQNSCTLHTLLSNPAQASTQLQIRRNPTREEQQNGLLCTFIKTLWLILGLNIFHADLHTNNTLIYFSASREINCQLIDFGNASDLANPVNDYFYTAVNKAAIRNRFNQYKREILATTNYTSNHHKETILRNIIQTAKVTDDALANRIWGADRGQMNFLLTTVNGLPTRKLVDAFNTLKTLLQDPSTTAAPTVRDITEMRTQRRLPNFSAPPLSALIEFTPPVLPGPVAPVAPVAPVPPAPGPVAPVAPVVPPVAPPIPYDSPVAPVAPVVPRGPPVAPAAPRGPPVVPRGPPVAPRGPPVVPVAPVPPVPPVPAPVVPRGPPIVLGGPPVAPPVAENPAFWRPRNYGDYLREKEEREKKKKKEEELKKLEEEKAAQEKQRNEWDAINARAKAREKALQDKEVAFALQNRLYEEQQKIKRAASLKRRQEEYDQQQEQEKLKMKEAYNIYDEFIKRIEEDRKKSERARMNKNYQIFVENERIKKENDEIREFEQSENQGYQKNLEEIDTLIQNTLSPTEKDSLNNLKNEILFEQWSTHERTRSDTLRLARERTKRLAEIEAERLEAERLEKERLQAERLKKERLQAERLEKERLEAQRLEAERLKQAHLIAEEVAYLEKQAKLAKKKLLADQSRLNKYERLGFADAAYLPKASHLNDAASIENASSFNFERALAAKRQQRQALKPTVHNTEEIRLKQIAALEEVAAAEEQMRQKKEIENISKQQAEEEKVKERTKTDIFLDKIHQQAEEKRQTAARLALKEQEERAAYEMSLANAAQQVQLLRQQAEQLLITKREESLRRQQQETLEERNRRITEFVLANKRIVDEQNEKDDELKQTLMKTAAKLKVAAKKAEGETKEQLLEETNRVMEQIKEIGLRMRQRIYDNTRQYLEDDKTEEEREALYARAERIIDKKNSTRFGGRKQTKRKANRKRKRTVKKH